MHLESKQLFELLKKTKIPVVYAFSKERKTLPYIVYRDDGLESFKADNNIFYKAKNFLVELYSDNKDFALEEKIELLFEENEIIYDKSERKPPIPALGSRNERILRPFSLNVACICCTTASTRNFGV